MSIPQFTTPTFVLEFSEQELDLTQAVNVYVTFCSQWYSLTKTGSDLELTAKSITVTLSQDETAQFKPGEIEIQANWIMPDGTRTASEIATYTVSKQLLKKVVE